MFVVLSPRPAIMNDLVNGAPVGEAAEGAVVDEEVGVELAGADAVFVDFFAWVVAVDGEEFEAAFFAEVYGFLQELAFTGGPEDERVSFRLYLLEGCYGEGEFLADVGITVLYDRTVEVYCYEHLFLLGFQNLDEVAFERAGGDYDDAGDFYDDASVACSLDFYECAFQAVELASVDAHLRAFGEVDFIRTEEEEAVAERAGDFHEVFHVAVRDDDRALSSVLCRDVYVSEGFVLLLEVEHRCLVGMDKDQVPYHRYILLDLGSASVEGYYVTHRNVGLIACFVKLFLYFHVPAVRCTHCKPDSVFTTAHTYSALASN